VVFPLDKSQIAVLASVQKTRKRGLFWPEWPLFGPKSGQKTGFEVTDSLTLPKCKLLISCKLLELFEQEEELHSVFSTFWRILRGINSEHGTVKRE
jgi:hypothetical protein